jgi:hypothetical protein
VPDRAVVGPNQVVADVVGLEGEQLVVIAGSRVEIVVPGADGARVLSSFEADLSAAWPEYERPLADALAFAGQETLAAVGHEASRVAVVGRRIAVSRVRRLQRCRAGDCAWERGGSVIELVEPDGTVVASRTFPDEVAVTALDGYSSGGVDYLAVGLDAGGVRVVRADRPGLPDHHAVHETWSDPVVAVKLGASDDGMVLVTGRVTQDGTALVATHGLSGRLLWSDNHRVAGDPLDYPLSIAVGPFGAAGAATVSVAWSLDGRLTLHDASRGTRPYSAEGQPQNPVTAQRFVTGRNGQHLLAVRRLRDAHAVLVSGGKRHSLA